MKSGRNGRDRRDGTVRGIAAAPVRLTPLGAALVAACAALAGGALLGAIDLLWY